MSIARRSFLLTPVGALAARAPIGIGMLGAVHSHAEGKLEVLLGSKDWRLVGVCESDPRIAESLRKRGIALLSRQQLLAHPQIRVVAVESAVRDHARDGRDVLLAGKHLHLEKPPADTLRAFAEIVELARSRRLLLQLGYMWRYHPGIVKALEAARQGWLGPIYLVKANIGNLLAPARRPEWGEFAGGVMFELGCHLIDPIVRLMGRPRKVRSILRTDGPYQDRLRDNTVALLEWDRAIGIVQATTLQHDASRYRALEIYGSNGSAIVNPIEPPALSLNLAKPAGPYRSGLQQVSLPEYRRYVEDFAELAAAVRREQTLRVTLEEDLLVQEVLLECSGMAERQG